MCENLKMSNINKFFAPEKISQNLRETPEGFLLCCDVAIARAGDLLYKDGEIDIEANDDGIAILSRTIEELSKEEAIASFEGKAVVIGHPIDENGHYVFLDPDNWSDFAVGMTQNVRKGEGENSDKIVADLLITDRKAIDAIISKEFRQISGGYSSKAVQISKGFGIQKDFRGNHIALVKSGRNGVECAIFDQMTLNRGNKMNLKKKFIKILGRTLDQMPELEEEIKNDGENEVMKMLARINLRLDKLEREQNDDYDYEDNVEKDELRSLIDNTFGSEKEAMPVQDRKKVRDSRRMRDKKRTRDESEFEEYEEEELYEKLETIEEALVHILKKLDDEDEEQVDEKSCYDEDVEEDGVDLIVDSNTLSKAEILAPGIRKSKDIKRKALQHAYKTEEGRRAINSVLDGKTFDSVDTSLLFNAAAEVLKGQRRDNVNATKFSAPVSSINRNNMSPQDMNAINARRWESKN